MTEEILTHAIAKRIVEQLDEIITNQEQTIQILRQIRGNTN